MPIFCCDGVKQKNILSVFNAVVDGGCRTRTEIASYTKLSKVTVGKVVDAFLDFGLLVEIKKSNSPGRGQKTGFVYPDSKKKIAVIDISGRRFSLSIFSIDLKHTYYSKYNFIDDATDTENLFNFVGRLKAIFDAMSKYQLIATGIILLGKYDRTTDKISFGATWTDNVRIRDFFKQQLGVNVDLLIDPTIAAANYCIRKSNKITNTLYVNATDTLSARLIVGNKHLRNYGTVLRRKFAMHPNADETASFIADAYSITGARDIYIETDIPDISYMQVRTFTKMVITKLVYCEEVPNIVINRNCSFSYLGAAFVMRRNFLERIIK